MAAFDTVRSSFDVHDDTSDDDSDDEGDGGPRAAARVAAPAPPPAVEPPPTTYPAAAGRTSAESARSDVSSSITAASLRSARSSFAAERGGDDDVGRLVGWLPASGRDPGPLPSLPSNLAPSVDALALVPPDTPLPAALLARLWRVGSPTAAAARADALASAGVMKVARLADGSVWGLALPAPHAAIVAARCGGPAAEHAALVLSYAGMEEEENEDGDQNNASPSPPPATTLATALAYTPDDGYWMHNLGHHLAGAGRLDALAALLGDPGWLDAKLRSYGAAAVTADFRRALAAPPSTATDRAKLLLAAFQMAAPAAAAAPKARGVLAAAMRARLVAAGVALPPSAAPPPVANADAASAPCRPALGLTPPHRVHGAGGRPRPASPCAATLRPLSGWPSPPTASTSSPPPRMVLSASSTWKWATVCCIYLPRAVAAASKPRPWTARAACSPPGAAPPATAACACGTWRAAPACANCAAMAAPCTVSPCVSEGARV